MKAVISALSDVIEALRGEYEPHEGKFRLKVEGDLPGFVSASTAQENAARLAEFRDNNRSLNTKVTELEAKLRGYDGVDVAALKAQIAELEGKQRGSKGDAEVKQLLEAAVAPLKQQLDALAAANKSKDEALADATLRTALTEAGVRAGVDERAITDYVRRGKEVFSVVDGKLVAKRGDVPLFSKARPAEPLSVDEWVADLPGEAPHLFKANKGGGAGGAGGTGGSGNADSVRTIAAGQKLSAQDVKDIADGKAVRETAVA